MFPPGSLRPIMMVVSDCRSYRPPTAQNILLRKEPFYSLPDFDEYIPVLFSVDHVFQSIPADITHTVIVQGFYFHTFHHGFLISDWVSFFKSIVIVPLS